jgi:hypothetical protein
VNIFLFSKELSEVFVSNLDCFYRLFIEPFDSFAFFPEAVFEVCFSCFVDTESMLFSTHPLTKIQSSVSPLVDTISMFLVVFVLAHVATTISPGIDTHVVHIVIKPLALILSSI